MRNKLPGDCIGDGSRRGAGFGGSDTGAVNMTRIALLPPVSRYVGASPVYVVCVRERADVLVCTLCVLCVCERERADMLVRHLCVLCVRERELMCWCFTCVCCVCERERADILVLHLCVLCV